MAFTRTGQPTRVYSGNAVRKGKTAYSKKLAFTVGEVFRGGSVLKQISSRYDGINRQFAETDLQRKFINSVIYEEQTHATPLENVTDIVTDTVGVAQISVYRHAKKYSTNKFNLLVSDYDNLRVANSFVNSEVFAAVKNKVHQLGDVPIVHELSGSFYNADSASAEYMVTDYGERIGATIGLVDDAISRIQGLEDLLNKWDVSDTVKDILLDVYSELENLSIVRKNIERRRLFESRREGTSISEVSQRTYLPKLEAEESDRNQLNPRKNRIEGFEIERPDRFNELIEIGPPLELPSHFHDQGRMDELYSTA